MGQVVLTLIAEVEEMASMRGPWRARGFDSVAWRPPTAQFGNGHGAVGHSTPDYLVGIVIGYVASVLTAVAIMLMFLRNGW